MAGGNIYLLQPLYNYNLHTSIETGIHLQIDRD